VCVGVHAGRPRAENAHDDQYPEAERLFDSDCPHRGGGPSQQLSLSSDSEKPMNRLLIAMAVIGKNHAIFSMSNRPRCMDQGVNAAHQDRRIHNGVNATRTTAKYPISECRGSASRTRANQAASLVRLAWTSSAPKDTNPPSQMPLASRCTDWLISWTRATRPSPMMAWPTQPRLAINRAARATRYPGCTVLIEQTMTSKTANRRCQRQTTPKLVLSGVATRGCGAAEVTPITTSLLPPLPLPLQTACVTRLVNDCRGPTCHDPRFPNRLRCDGGGARTLAPHA
jgi:hypothetical protein